MFKTSFHKTTLSFNKYFQNKHFVCVLNDAGIITKFSALRHFSKYFQTHSQSIFKSELASKRPQITTDEKGANTFPFHNLPPELKDYQGLSHSFHPFLILDKRQVDGDSCYTHIWIKTKKISSPTVLQNWLLCWGIHKKEGLPQG